MKKFLTLCATFTLVGALFVGCIDNKEPGGVALVREAIAELYKAKALYQKALVDYVQADAEFRRAQADLEKAKAAILNQKAETIKLENELLKLQVDLEKAINALKTEVEKARLQAEIVLIQSQLDAEKARLAAATARYNAQAQRALTRLWNEKAATEAAERAYLQSLLTTMETMRQDEIKALDNITFEIADLLLKQAAVRNEIMVWQARYYFYETVEVPHIQRRLEHDLELSHLNLTYCEFMYKLWADIKNLAFSEYVKYADEMYPKMLEIEKREVTLRANLENERFKLVDLETAEAAARYAYLYSGVNTALTNVSIPNVFSTTANDIFKIGNVAHGEEEYTGTVINKGVLSGVFHNTYSLYWNWTGSPAEDYPVGTIASLGYKNTLERLQADYDLIKDGRIYGMESGVSVAATLADRKSKMDAAIKAYKDTCKVWRDTYTATVGGGTWKDEKKAYDDAVADYAKLYGKPYAPADLESMLLAVSLCLTSPDVNVQQFMLSQLPINTLYIVQSTLIRQYIAIINALVKGEFGAGESYLAGVEMSDVLGGITFSPSALFELVVGKGNAKTFKTIVDYIMGAAAGIDLVRILNAVMPAYYAKAESFLGSSIWGQGPIFQKYNVTSDWEYHAWFLIYYLFENNPVSIGNSIFKINANYTNAADKLCDDFLGLHLVDFPGYYDVTKTAVKSGTTIKLADRLAEFKGNIAFNTGAAVASLASTHPINTVLKAEDNLRAKWHAYGKDLNALNRSDMALYYPWHSAWTVTGYDLTKWDVANTGTPIWISNTYSTVKDLVRTAASLAKAFYFMPEKAMDKNHPSIEDGEDLYWTDLWGTIPTGNYAWQANFYPSIAAKQSKLTGVNWNQWINVGYPTYVHDPILWQNDFTAANTWENNINISLLAYVPKSMVTTRNYKQYEFWSDPATQAAYVALADEIALLIAPLQAKVDALYQAWIDATAARILKQYEIDAIQYEADLCNTAYQSMYAAYLALYQNIPEANFTEYTTWFNLYTDAKKQFDFDKANLDTFNSNALKYVYSDGDPLASGFTASGLNFIEDQRIWIDANIKRLEDRLATIVSQLAACEKERARVLDLYKK